LPTFQPDALDFFRAFFALKKARASVFKLVLENYPEYDTHV